MNPSGPATRARTGTAAGAASSSSEPFHLMGAGFGPANLSLAVLLQEEAEEGRVTCIGSSWKPGRGMPRARSRP